jgi:hypothetical protein
MARLSRRPIDRLRRQPVFFHGNMSWGEAAASSGAALVSRLQTLNYGWTLLPSGDACSPCPKNEASVQHQRHCLALSI